MALLVSDDFEGVRGPLARVFTLLRCRFKLAVVARVHVGPAGPRVGLLSYGRRCGVILQLRDALGPLPECCGQAVGARVAASHDDDVKATGVD